MPCRIIPHGTLEIRKYSPHRRTIRVWDYCEGDRLRRKERDFFVPIPYQVYFGIPVEGGFKAFAMAFAKADDEFVYAAPFGYPSGDAICVDGDYHFAFPGEMDLSEIINRFWSTSFNFVPHLESVFRVRSIQEWGKLTPRQVTRRLSYGKYSLEETITKCHLASEYVDRWLGGALEGGFKDVWNR